MSDKTICPVFVLIKINIAIFSDNHSNSNVNLIELGSCDHDGHDACEKIFENNPPPKDTALNKLQKPSNDKNGNDMHNQEL